MMKKKNEEKINQNQTLNLKLNLKKKKKNPFKKFVNLILDYFELNSLSKAK